MGGVVHVEGGGPLADALTLLLLDLGKDAGISQVSVHRRSITVHDRPHLKALLGMGAVLCAQGDAKRSAQAMNLAVDLSPQDAIKAAGVVVRTASPWDPVDVTQPPGAPVPTVWLEGSGAGASLVCHGVNHTLLKPGEHVQLAIPNPLVHGMAAVVHALSKEGKAAVEDVRFHLLRQGAPLHHGADTLPNLVLEPLENPLHGVPDAATAHTLLEGAGTMAPLFAAATTLPNQLMDGLQFSVRLKDATPLGEATSRLQAAPRTAWTEKLSPQPLFSLARDLGWRGRLFNQLILPRPALAVQGGRTVHGMAWTPGSGSSLVSALWAVLWLLEPAHAASRLALLAPWVLEEA